MDDIEHFLLFLRGREAQLVSVGLMGTEDVQVSEAIRQVCYFETFPDVVSHKSVFCAGNKSLCCLPKAWMNGKVHL